MRLDFRLPIFEELDKAENILLAGAGGGFDVCTGLPLYFLLKNAGKQVHLANLSFSTLFASTGKVLAPALVEVTAKTEGSLRYFPEQHLARWFQQRGEDVPIYCFDCTGARPITEAYQVLTERLQPDTILLVDGGTDSLMRGDEVGLGTPEEDIASIAAVDALDVPRKLLVCLGFGIDTFHGVCHAQFLEAVADLTQAGGYLGAWSLLPEMSEVQLYRKAMDAIHQEMRNHPSIVNTSILAAIEGRFGDYHTTYRTEGSELFINPLMALYWGFRLEPVARRCLYLDQIRETETYQELTVAIQRFRFQLEYGSGVKEWKNLPM